MDIRDLPATHARLRHVAARLGLSADAYVRARELAALRPDPLAWQRRLDRFLFGAAVGLVLAGVVAFFAYNWGGFHPFVKFALIEAGIVASVVVAWRAGLDSRAGRAALLAAAVLTGVLFAVHGQVYQTGADPYRLFLVWALLALGWAWVGRQQGLWMLVVILLNVALILYWTQVLFPQPFGLGFAGPLFALAGALLDARLGVLVFALDAAALALWEVLARRREWMEGRGFPGLMAGLALTPVVSASLALVLGVRYEASAVWHALGLVLFVSFAGGALHYYRRRVRDLFILTCCLLGAILIVTAAASRLGGSGFEVWWLLAVLIVGQTTGAALWLRNVAQEWEDTA